MEEEKKQEGAQEKVQEAQGEVSQQNQQGQQNQVNQRPGQQPGQEPMRVRLPRGKEMIGEIIELLGASRFRVSCKDGNTRICRMPGKFRRRMRIRVGDLVIFEPWDIEPKDKGDIIWIYTRTQANWLRNKGHV